MKIKKMNIKEFREKGYLQELNRRFLHPLGLALEVAIDEDGKETIGDVWDDREDKEGIHYGLEFSNKERLAAFNSKASFISSEEERRKVDRINALHFWQEPIPEKIK